MLLINMRQIKTHSNKVIGNEIIIRQVIELGVKTKLEEGQRDTASRSCRVWQEQKGECGDSAVRTRGSETRCWVRAGLGSSEQMGGEC